MIRSETEATKRNAAEDAFCKAWLESRDAQMRPMVFASMACVHLVSLVIEPFILGTGLVRVAWGLHATSVPLLLYGLLARKSSDSKRRIQANAIHVSVLGSWAMLYFATQVSQTLSDIVIAAAVYMGVGMFLPQIFPAGRREMLAIILISIGLAQYAMRNVDNGWVWTYIFATMSFWSTLLAELARRSRWREAQSEYRFRVQVVPEHIVRHTRDQSVTDLSELFRPEEKFCVCISSDWRNYQELCTNISTSRLTASLNAYYALCQDLIRRSFPAGNYYTDWIADELFVVAYLTEGTTEAEMTTAAAAFSLELLAAKAEFYETHGIPARIDIGIAAGLASIGLMGPEGHRKATALGEIPGRARRLQGAGKIISRRLGELDRLIMDSECRRRLSTGYEIEAFVLDGNESIRDLKDREIFYATALAKRPSQAKRLDRVA